MLPENHQTENYPLPRYAHRPRRCVPKGNRREGKLFVDRFKQRSQLSCLERDFRMALSQESNQQRIVDPAYRKLHHTLLAVCIVVAPLVILLGFALDPELGTPLQGAATIAAWKADNPLLIQWFLFFNVVTPYVYPVSIFALGLLAIKRSPWLATIGILIGLAGALPFPVFVAQESLAYEIIYVPHSVALAPLLQGLNNEWPVFFLHLTWVPDHLLGWLILGIALWRAHVIPLWAASCIVVNVPLTMVAYGRFEGIWQIVGTALIFIGSIPAALAMFRGRDESASVSTSEEAAQAT